MVRTRQQRRIEREQRRRDGFDSNASQLSISPRSFISRRKRKRRQRSPFAPDVPQPTQTTEQSVVNQGGGQVGYPSEDAAAFLRRQSSSEDSDSQLEESSSDSEGDLHLRALFTSAGQQANKRKTPIEESSSSSTELSSDEEAVEASPKKLRLAAKKASSPENRSQPFGVAHSQSSQGSDESSEVVFVSEQSQSQARKATGSPHTSRSSHHSLTSTESRSRAPWASPLPFSIFSASPARSPVPLTTTPPSGVLAPVPASSEPKTKSVLSARWSGEEEKKTYAFFCSDDAGMGETPSSSNIPCQGLSAGQPLYTSTPAFRGRSRSLPGLKTTTLARPHSLSRRHRSLWHGAASSPTYTPPPLPSPVQCIGGAEQAESTFQDYPREASCGPPLPSPCVLWSQLTQEAKRRGPKHRPPPYVTSHEDPMSTQSASHSRAATAGDPQTVKSTQARDSYSMHASSPSKTTKGPAAVLPPLPRRARSSILVQKQGGESPMSTSAPEKRKEHKTAVPSPQPEQEKTSASPPSRKQETHGGPPVRKAGTPISISSSSDVPGKTTSPRPREHQSKQGVITPGDSPIPLPAPPSRQQSRDILVKSPPQQSPEKPRVRSPIPLPWPKPTPPESPSSSRSTQSRSSNMPIPPPPPMLHSPIPVKGQEEIDLLGDDGNAGRSHLLTSPVVLPTSSPWSPSSPKGTSNV